MLLSRRKLVRVLAVGAALFPFVGTGSQAESSPRPAGDVVLTIGGAISVPNTSEGSSFDIAMLEALPATTIRTRTNWTQGVITFQGVLLKDLLTAVGARGSRLHAAAINDYAVDIPTSDAVEGGPIVAYLLNGHPMSIRDKGPLWIVYPFDADPKYQSEIIYSRSIWQLSRITITP